jgi:NAD(P)-dependent dehydrogenase (short-subunit alcohol dehydrogenase family)
MNVLVTGASRGLGLEFVRRFSERGDHVFATARNPQKVAEWKSFSNVTPVALDVTDETSIKAAAKQVLESTDSLDLLINNAGVLLGMSAMKEAGQSDRLGQLTMEHGLTIMKTNAIGSILVAQEFLPLLKKGKNPKIVSITSGYGSLAETASGQPYHYKASKAALNMYMHGLAVDLRSHGIISVVINPGWVSTAMGGPSASLTPEQSVSGMLKVIDKLTLRQTGKFFDWQGDEEPW